jgi:ribosomal protein S27AE
VSKDDDVRRVAEQFHQDLERAAVEVETTNSADEDFAVCPSCGSVLVAGEYGCPRCGYGRKSFLAEHRRMILVIAVCLVIGGLLLLFRVFARSP